MERKYTVMHKWADDYTASRHGGTCKWSPVLEGVQYSKACDCVLEQIAMEDGSPCETMRKAYGAGLAVRLQGETRFNYDVSIYAIVATSRVRKWLRENGENLGGAK